MTGRVVLKMGNPLLRAVAAPVDNFASTELDQLIGDLWDTMRAEGGIGIAAPQIGVSLRVVVFGLEHHSRSADNDPIAPTVLINPEIEPLGDTTESGWEACLSVPGMRGLVPRYQHIRYVGFDAAGERFEREAHGYHARVVQHECDHLDGILYPMRMPDLALFGYADEIERAAAATANDED